MRLLFDTNIILDLLLDRAPFADEAEQLWAAVDEGRFRGSIVTFSIPTIHYIVARHHSLAKATDAVWACITSFDLAATYRENIIAAARGGVGGFYAKKAPALAAKRAGHWLPLNTPSLRPTYD